MTSEFDKIRSIVEEARKESKFMPITNWLLDICIEEANKAKEGWNFGYWKSKNDALYKGLYQDWTFEEKSGFLDDCHDILAHQAIEAFTFDTHKLINEVYNAVFGRDVYDVDKLRKKFPDLPKLLEKLGYKALDKRGWMWAKQ